MSFVVFGDDAALELAGAPSPEGAPRVLFALDDVPARGSGSTVVRWWREEPGELSADRVIATGGEHLWARAPWPVRDELFDLPAPSGAGVLVVEADEDARGAALTELRGRGLEAESAERLTAAALERAAVVLHGVRPARPLPGDAFAVLAAGRLLIGRGEPAFGLHAGIDHLSAEGFGPAADLAQAALADAPAFAAIARFARLAARPHRASLVYARLAAAALS